MNIKKYDWVWFDLDDTLHDFKHSSSIAINESLNFFCSQSAVKPEEATQVFANIFKDSQKNYFVDGRSSKENRSERFEKLIHQYRHKFTAPEDFVDILLQKYNEALLSNLKPYDDMEALLIALKKEGKKIAIVSEAPFDAQQTILKKLGIDVLCDILITSGKEKLSKSDGLFERAREITKADSAGILILGDSLERDIQPALNLNIDACLVDHKHHYSNIKNINIIHDFTPLLAACESTGQ